MSSNAKKQALSALEQLKEKTIVVADTGDFEGIELNNWSWSSIFIMIVIF